MDAGSTPSPSIASASLTNVPITRDVKKPRLSLTPIVVNDSRGFFTSRVIGTFVNEALAMLGEGVEPASIEHAGSQAGYPAPPLQLSDELNLELMHKIAVASRKGV